MAYRRPKPVNQMSGIEKKDHTIRIRLNSGHTRCTDLGRNPPEFPPEMNAPLGTFPSMVIALRIMLEVIETKPDQWDPNLTLEHVAALIEYGNFCALCDLEGTIFDRLGLDRILHGERGGLYTLLNIRPAHAGCNDFRRTFTDGQIFLMVKQTHANILSRDPALPLTPASAVEALLRGRLVPAADVAPTPWNLQPAPVITQEMHDEPHGAPLSLARKTYRAYTQVRNGPVRNRWRLDLGGTEEFFRVTIPNRCYMSNVESVLGSWGCVDRVDPALGYGPHNGLPCSNICNLSKGDRTLLEHLTTLLAIHASAGYQAWAAQHDAWGPYAALQERLCKNAQTLLERYRDHHTVFNDDIQGTATTAVGGVYGALGVLGQGPEAIADQRFVVVGAGSAGMGVVDMLASAMQRHGLSAETAADRFHVLDSKGLVTAARPNLTPAVEPFARKDGTIEDGTGLLEVVTAVRPTALIGLSGAGRLFTPDVLRVMGEINEHPIIFPMSNPTLQMECTHEEAQAATDGRAIFAAGSPQPDVAVGDRLCVASQANNLYIFPGIAQGALLAHSGHVSDYMLMAAAEALPRLVTPEERARGQVYPDLSRIREISLAVACEVIKAAAEEGRLGNPEAARALARGDDCLTRWVLGHMWKPDYKSLVAPSHATRGFTSTRAV